jgi:hypothetical protein
MLASAMLAGCLLEPSPRGSGTTPTRDDSPAEAAPLDSLSYTSRPVPTGLLADMLMLVGELYEPQDNWWNTKVTNAPVDPSSAQIIALIASYSSNGGRLHPDFAPDSGIRYCVVDENTPLVHRPPPRSSTCTQMAAGEAEPVFQQPASAHGDGAPYSSSTSVAMNSSQGVTCTIKSRSNSFLSISGMGGPPAA